ncbi:MAG TPA: bifunctional DNA-formamidopyrimidine glycosylase/DNA-(apurinic or apyrimidinic site) lyase [Euzebya sp.]|nr:bifunctional DNA-formamidopyrimidine glycosylase/DNA-(apurinic or apyrimidinic site) lyase [Euzebya sp.]
MPELPEVESVRRQLAPRLVGLTISDVWTDPAMPRYIRPQEAAGLQVIGLRRRGKYLIADLHGEIGAAGTPLRADLILHLGMTGILRWRGADGWQPDTYVRASISFTDGSVLDFRDVRRFGTFAVTPQDLHDELPTLAALGPEPLSPDFTKAGFAAALARSRQAIKPLLLSQRPVAGVGNIYADEALWQSRIHPMARRLGRARSDRLWRAIREVLAASIQREGTTFRDYQMVNGESGRNAGFLIAYGQEGQPCPRCGRPMRKITLGGRGTTYCPGCQR